MTEYLAVFRSRSQAMDCMAKLRAYNIPARLINTPREANVGCGLSIIISSAAYGRARGVIARIGYTSFYGYMRTETKNGKLFIKGF